MKEALYRHADLLVPENLDTIFAGRVDCRYPQTLLATTGCRRVVEFCSIVVGYGTRRAQYHILASAPPGPSDSSSRIKTERRSRLTTPKLTSHIERRKKLACLATCTAPRLLHAQIITRATKKVVTAEKTLFIVLRQVCGLQDYRSSSSLLVLANVIRPGPDCSATLCTACILRGKSVLQVSSVLSSSVVATSSGRSHSSNRIGSHA
ncbi:hypothetical protein MRB53_037378 [Persea americana]|nr:hypothetical protein MRB53_037378 [Persea americana]